MSARGKARKRAVDILYEAEMRGLSSTDVLIQAQSRMKQDSATDLNPLVERLVRGVAANQPVLDATIASHSVGWSIERMPAVDRAILRVGCFELVDEPDTPPAVVIAEAVKLASSLSTDESGSFVNGVLAAIARDQPGLQRLGPELAVNTQSLDGPGHA